MHTSINTINTILIIFILLVFFWYRYQYGTLVCWNTSEPPMHTPILGIFNTFIISCTLNTEHYKLGEMDLQNSFGISGWTETLITFNLYLATLATGLDLTWSLMMGTAHLSSSGIILFLLARMQKGFSWFFQIQFFSKTPRIWFSKSRLGFIKTEIKKWEQNWSYLGQCRDCIKNLKYLSISFKFWIISGVKIVTKQNWVTEKSNCYSLRSPIFFKIIKVNNKSKSI